MNRNEFKIAFEIVQCAIDLHAREEVRKTMHLALKAAYNDWKARHGVGRVERNTLAWIQMMEATKPIYLSFQSTKNAERNARRRLNAAVLRLHGEIIPVQFTGSAA